MARGVYYSGDLVGLNDAMASEEMNRIRARTANQGFLGQLAGEATKRRGQDTEERIARGRNETDMGMQQSRAGEQRYATDVAKERNGFALQESIRNYQLERDKLAQIQANASSLNALDNRKLDALIEQNKEEGKRLVKIAEMSLEASKNRYSPAGERAIFEANADIDSINEEAGSAAQIANLGLDKAMEGTIPWYSKNPKGDPTKLARDLQLQLPATQQGLVQFDPATKRFVPRLRQRMSMGASGAATPTAPALTPQASAVGPMATGLVPASPDQPSTSIFDLVRGARTNPSLINSNPPAPSIRSAPPAQQPGPSLQELIAMALPPIPRGEPGMRRVDLSPGATPQEPGKRTVMLSVPGRRRPSAPDMLSLQELIALAQQETAPQGPPMRLGRNPFSQEGFDDGIYVNMDGTIGAGGALPRGPSTVPQFDLQQLIADSIATARRQPDSQPRIVIGPR